MKTRFLTGLISLMCLTFLPLTLSAQMDLPVEDTDYKTIIIDVVLIILAVDCAIKWIGFFRDNSDKQRQMHWHLVRHVMWNYHNFLIN